MGSVAAEHAPESPTAPGRGTVRRPLTLLAVVAAIVVALDQLTKWWALEALTDPVRIIDLFWTLRFRVIFNTGTAFSLTSDSGPFVTVIAVVVVGYLLVSGRNQRSPWVVVCYGLVVGGTLGNLVDRAFRDGDGLLGGPVIDFVDPQWFPVFNLADASLVVGIAVLLVVGFATDGAAFEPDAAAGDEPAEEPGREPADDPADDTTGAS